MSNEYSSVFLIHFLTDDMRKIRELLRCNPEKLSRISLTFSILITYLPRPLLWLVRMVIVPNFTPASKVMRWGEYGSMHHRTRVIALPFYPEEILFACANPKSFQARLMLRVTRKLLNQLLGHKNRKSVIFGLGGYIAPFYAKFQKILWSSIRCYTTGNLLTAITACDSVMLLLQQPSALRKSGKVVILGAAGDVGKMAIQELIQAGLKRENIYCGIRLGHAFLSQKHTLGKLSVPTENIFDTTSEQLSQACLHAEIILSCTTSPTPIVIPQGDRLFQRSIIALGKPIDVTSDDGAVIAGVDIEPEFPHMVKTVLSTERRGVIFPCSAETWLVGTYQDPDMTHGRWSIEKSLRLRKAFLDSRWKIAPLEFLDGRQVIAANQQESVLTVLSHQN